MIRSYISQQQQVFRALHSRIGKTAVIYPSAFLVATSLGMVILGMVFYTNEVFGASPGQVGCVYATWALSYVFGCILLRPVSSLLLPRYSVLLATSLMVLVLAGILGVGRFVWIFPMYSLFGLATSFFWPPLMGWLSANREGDELGRAMGRFNLCWSSGMVISPVAGGWLSQIDVRLPLACGVLLLLATVALVLGAVLTLSSLTEDDDAHQKERAQARGKGTDNSTFLRFPAWLGVFASYAVAGAILNVFPLSAQYDLGMSKTAVGCLLFLRALMNMAALGWMGRTECWHFRGRQMFLGILTLSIVVLGLAWAGAPLAIGLLMLLIGIFGGQSYANSLFHGVSGSIRRAGRMAIHEALLSAGAIFGATLGGFTYQRHGTAMMYSGCAVFLLAIAIGQAWLVRRHERTLRENNAN